MGNAKIIPANTLLLPYQKKWVLDRSRMKFAVKSRQIGWTWAESYSLVRRKGLKNATLDAWISSRDLATAKLFTGSCKSFANVLQIGAEDLGEQVLHLEGGKKESSFELRFGNGLVIHSLSSNPDAQAGRVGDRVIDEAGLHPQFKDLYGIARPGITWGGQLEIFSTPRGSDQYFSVLLKEIEEKGNPKGFSFHKVTLRDALNDGFLYKLQQKLPPDDEVQDMDEDQYFDWVRNSCPDEEYFMQEYMCTPSNDETAFISYELLNKCRIGGHVENESHVKIEDKKLGEKGITYWVSNDPIGPGPLYLGVDIGRHKDLTVMWLAEKVAGRLITRKVAFLNRVPFRRQEVILRVEFLDLKNLIRACIDQTGIGEQMAENAQADYGYKVECVRFNIEVKITMAFAVRTAMEDGAFLTPDAPRIESSFRKIKKTTTVAGNIRFDGERDKDGHADDFWAGALCKHGEASPNEGYCAPPDIDELSDFEGGGGRSIHPYAGGYRRMV